MRPHSSRDDGATAIEVALILPVFLATVLMTLYGGLYLYYAAVAEHVARHAVRDATLPVSGTSTYPTTGQVYTDAKTTGGPLIPAPTSVSLASNPSSGDPREGDEVTVTVTYQLPAVQSVANMMWFLPAPRTTVTRTATGRRE